MRTKYRKILLAWALFGLMTSTMWGHDLYFRPPVTKVPAGSPQSIAMHNGDSFPSSDGPPVLARLRDMAVISAGGKKELQRVRVEGKAGMADYEAPKGSFVVTARTIPNLLELDPKSFESYLEHENLKHVIQWRAQNGESQKKSREFYSKNAKALMNLDEDDFALRPVGLPVEIVLLKNPSKLKVGDQLPVQVLFDGRPATALMVEVSWTPRKRKEHTWVGPTDQEGKLLIPVEALGFWKLHCIVMQRKADTSKADWESSWASVTFAMGPSY